MSNYLEKKIREVKDDGFKSLVAGLCHCINKNPALFSDHPLSYLLMVIGREDPKTLAKQYLPGPGILTTKVDKLSPDSVVHQVCCELANSKRARIESFDGKMVLSLIKSCYRIFCPEIARQRKPTRNERRHLHTTEIILRRRNNGSL